MIGTMTEVSSKIVVVTILIAFSAHEARPAPNKGVSSQCCEDGLSVEQSAETADIDRIVYRRADNKSNVYYIDLYGESTNGSVNNKVIIINKLVSNGEAGEESDEQIVDLAVLVDKDSNLNGTSTLLSETVETDSSVNDLPGFTSNATNNDLDDEGEAIVEDVEDGLISGVFGSTVDSYSDHEIATDDHWFDDYVSSSSSGNWYEDILNAIESGESEETSLSQQGLGVTPEADDTNDLEGNYISTSYSGEDDFEPETEEESDEKTDNLLYSTDATEITNGNTGRPGQDGYDSSTSSAETEKSQPFVSESPPSLVVTPEADDTDDAEENEISASSSVEDELETEENSEEKTAENLPYSTDTAEITNGNTGRPGQDGYWTESSTSFTASEETQPVVSNNPPSSTDTSNTFTTDGNTGQIGFDEDDNSFPSKEDEEILLITSETNHTVSSTLSTESLPEANGNPSNSAVTPNGITDQSVSADDGNSFPPEMNEEMLPFNSEDFPTSTDTSTTFNLTTNENTEQAGSAEVNTVPSLAVSTETVPEASGNSPTSTNTTVTTNGITDLSVSADDGNSFPPEEILPFNSEVLPASTHTSTTLTTVGNAKETGSAKDDTTFSSVVITEILPETSGNPPTSTNTTITTLGITDQPDSPADGNSFPSEVDEETLSFTSETLPTSTDTSTTLTTDGNAVQTGSAKDDTTSSSVVTNEILPEVSGNPLTSTDTTVTMNEITDQPKSTEKYSTSEGNVDISFTIANPPTSTDATVTTIITTDLSGSAEDNYSSPDGNEEGLPLTSDLPFTDTVVTNNGNTDSSGSVLDGNSSLEKESEGTGNQISSTDYADTTYNATTPQPGFVENNNISTSIVGEETQPTSDEPSSYMDSNETTNGVSEQPELGEDSSYPSEVSEETPLANGNFVSSTGPGSTEESTLPSLPDTLALNDSAVTDDAVTSILPADINPPQLPLRTSTNASHMSDTSAVVNSNTPIIIPLKPTVHHDLTIAGAQLMTKPPIATIAPNVQNTYYPPHIQVLYPLRPTHPPYMPQSPTSKAPYLMDSAHYLSASTVPPRAPVSSLIPTGPQTPPVSGAYVVPNVPFHSDVPSYSKVPNAYYPHQGQVVRPLPVSRPYVYPYAYHLPQHNQQYLPQYSYHPFWRSGQIDSTAEQTHNQSNTN